MNKGAAVSLIKQTFSDWSEDKAPRLGAALAYYAIFSIPPLILLVIAAVGLVYKGDVAGAIQTQLATLIGANTAQTIMQTSQQPEGKSAAVGIAGVAILLFGASGVFAQLQDAMNTIWEVKPKAKRGVMGMIKDRFLSFTMVLGIAFLLLVSLVLTAAISAFGSAAAVGHILELVISFAVITLLFAMIFKLLPDVKIRWSDVWVGAAMTAALFTIGKFAIGLYLGRSSVGSAYGAAGAVIVMIVWIYYSAQILFLGAEFTQVYANQYGSHVTPAENAEPVTAEKRAQEGLTSSATATTATSAARPANVRPVTAPTPSPVVGLAAAAAMILGFVFGKRTGGTHAATRS